MFCLLLLLGFLMFYSMSWSRVIFPIWNSPREIICLKRINFLIFLYREKLLDFLLLGLLAVLMVVLNDAFLLSVDGCYEKILNTKQRPRFMIYATSPSALSECYKTYGERGLLRSSVSKIVLTSLLTKPPPNYIVRTYCNCVPIWGNSGKGLELYG